MIKAQKGFNKEKYWRTALDISKTAAESKSLVPLTTKVLKIYSHSNYNFELRKLISKTPLHLFKESSQRNPFQPWNKDLEVASIEDSHILLLNKYPVQIGHMLLITKNWAPQNGWLTIKDWKSISLVNRDTTGLWFFNSCPEAGASQPHRHFQLLRRSADEKFCPRDIWFENFLNKKLTNDTKLTKSAYIVDIDISKCNAEYLNNKYLFACLNANIGNPTKDKVPLSPYNILLCNKWMIVIRRSRDCINGFSVNALGFAGYLLATEHSDIHWLDNNGPEYLLENVVEPYQP